jgi:PIN domain nuclease of toxin-antitoxin system
MDVVTDTHGLIWYLEDNPRLGSNASRLFNECDDGRATVYVPTICLVEIVCLTEKGRIPPNLQEQLSNELRGGATGLVVTDLTMGVVNELVKVPRSQVPDLTDRVIAATALHLGLPVISRDRKIRLSTVTTIW